MDTNSNTLHDIINSKIGFNIFVRNIRDDKHLDLSYSKSYPESAIYSLPKNFKNLKITSLSLSSQKIAHIENLPSQLEKLYLGSKSLVSFKVPNSLKELVIYGYKSMELPDLSHLSLKKLEHHGHPVLIKHNCPNRALLDKWNVPYHLIEKSLVGDL